MADKKYTRFTVDNRLEAMAENMYPGGVRIDPLPATAGQEVCILYSGLLANSGADQVYLHVGYGDAGKWKKVEDVEMDKTGYGWVKVLPAHDLGAMHFCFHDSAHNWDNNNGVNWTIQVHNG
ncbi:carbohydrate-binding protein [Heliomicrobium undosum]|nr:carbohydrate-binding protein [Heliomicrobium undosum]